MSAGAWEAALRSAYEHKSYTVAVDELVARVLEDPGWLAAAEEKPLDTAEVSAQDGGR